MGHLFISHMAQEGIRFNLTTAILFSKWTRCQFSRVNYGIWGKFNDDSSK